MIKIPYRITTFPKIKRKYKFIIIHDTTCMFPNLQFAKVDSTKSKVAKLRANNLIFNKQFDLNYHFLCENVEGDFESYIGRPFNRLCEYEDMTDIYQNGVHVCVFGDFNIIEAKQRIYQQVSYRVLAPMMYWFNIPLNRVVLHNQISSNKELK